MEKTEHRKIAVDCFNTTWKVLEKENKTAEDQAEAILLAHTSLWHWMQCGEPIHSQRGEWMISRVYAVLGYGEMSLFHAQRCLNYTTTHNFKDFDLSFAYEAMARAYWICGRKGDALPFYLLAKNSADQIEKTEDRDYFLSDIATIEL